MGKKVIVISTSLRGKSNSEHLAEEFARGAREAGNEVTYLSLKGKKIGFCIGCMTCQKTGSCAIKDDAVMIEPQVLAADVVVFATPIYYYEMSGQMKTLLDRLNSMYTKEFHFREVYLLTTAAEDEAFVPERAENGLTGWIDCFDGVELKGTLFCGGVDKPNEIEGNPKLREAYELGKSV